MNEIDVDKTDAKMKSKQYAKELRRLQTELCRLQEWVKLKGLRVMVLFEGRDAAGKGGTIKAITERVSPRVFRLVALPAPSDREKTQMYLQRYMPHFPAAGEVVIFDRSWYNRAGVERVMGSAPKKNIVVSWRIVPSWRNTLSMAGSSSSSFGWRSERRSRTRRFAARIDDPMRQWKLSPMDIESWTRWYDYSRARDMMLTPRIRVRAVAPRAIGR